MRGKKLIAVAILLLCGCSGGEKNAPFVRCVSLTYPKISNGEVQKSYPGVIEAGDHVSLGFKTAGQIERIYVKEGDRVRKGQLLARLDAKDYKLGVEAAQIQYDQLNDEVARLQKLLNEKSITKNDYEKAVAGLKQLGVQLKANKNKLEYTELRAPFNGSIQKVNFSPSEMVDAGTTVFNMLDLSHLEVVTDIPASDYLRRDDFISIYCRATESDSDMPMTLLSITPKADGNQLYRMRAIFKDTPDERVTAGMNVEVKVTIADTAASTSFIVPVQSVFKDGDTTCVWIYGNDSTVSKRPVVVGNIVENGGIVITDGLNGDERIVRAGVNMLLDGEKVRTTDKSDTNIGGLL